MNRFMAARHTYGQTPRDVSSGQPGFPEWVLQQAPPEALILTVSMFSAAVVFLYYRRKYRDVFDSYSSVTWIKQLYYPPNAF